MTIHSFVFGLSGFHSQSRSRLNVFDSLISFSFLYKLIEKDGWRIRINSGIFGDRWNPILIPTRREGWQQVKLYGIRIFVYYHLSTRYPRLYLTFDLFVAKSRFNTFVQVIEYWSLKKREFQSLEQNWHYIYVQAIQRYKSDKTLLFPSLENYFYWQFEQKYNFITDTIKMSKIINIYSAYFCGKCKTKPLPFEINWTITEWNKFNHKTIIVWNLHQRFGRMPDRPDCIQVVALTSAKSIPQFSRFFSTRFWFWQKNCPCPARNLKLPGSCLAPESLNWLIHFFNCLTTISLKFFYEMYTFKYFELHINCII